MKIPSVLMLALVNGIALTPIKASAAPITVVALGDSLTQGFGLEQGTGFVPQLQAWLDGRGHDIVVINAGVSGDTSAGGASRVEWTLTEDVDAMIVALGGNDLLRGIGPEVTRANIVSILDAAEARDVEVLLIGMQAPLNYGEQYKQDFDAIWPELSEQYGTLYSSSFFNGLREGGAEGIGELQAYFQDDGIHPNAEGVALIVEDIGPRVEALIADTAPGM